MQKSYERFLVLAQTLHFTRAANQLYITQQALSDQILHLEEDLDTQLFIRKPKLQLTPAGRILQQSLLQMQRIERSMKAQIGSLSSEEEGDIVIGIHFARLFVLFSHLLSHFHEKYPRIHIASVSAQTFQFPQMLEMGKIDFYLGINARIMPHGNLEAIPLVSEHICVVIHQKALIRAFGSNFRNHLPELYSGVDLNYFTEIPFIYSHEISQLQALVNKYLAQNRIVLHIALEYEDYALSYRLLSSIGGACFIYEMMLPFIDEYNQTCPEEEKLYYFPLLNCQEKLLTSLVRYKGAFFPPYTEYLFQLIKDTANSLVGTKPDQPIVFSD